MKRLRMSSAVLLLSLLSFQLVARSDAWAGPHHHGNGHHHGHHHHQGDGHHHEGQHHYHHRYSRGYWYGHHGRWYGPGYANRWNWNSFGALAGAAVIGGLVSSAFDASQPTITVPDSSYTLDYDSIRANGNLITFQVDGAPMSADCSSGYLNGRSPQSRGQAQLVNAVCTVAFGV